MARDGGVTCHAVTCSQAVALDVPDVSGHREHMRFVPVEDADSAADDPWTNYDLRRQLSRAHKLVAEMYGQLYVSGLKLAHDDRLITQLCKELDACEERLGAREKQLGACEKQLGACERQLQQERAARQQAELWQQVLLAQAPSRSPSQVPLETQLPQPPQPPQPRQPRQPPRKKGRR